MPGKGEPFARPQFLARFASAGRKCGAEDEGARIALLLDANAKLAATEMFDLAEDCFRHGDNGEKRAVMRTLSLLQHPELYVELAAQACRSSVQTVFEALACENPFPAATMPDLLFNQMILKAVFTEVALDRVMRLESRITPELSRMAEGYASERRAAGRTVPFDLGKLIRRP